MRDALDRWSAPDPAQEGLRRAFLARLDGESLDVAWFGLDALPVQHGVDLQALVTAGVRAERSVRTGPRPPVSRGGGGRRG